MRQIHFLYFHFTWLTFSSFVVSASQFSVHLCHGNADTTAIFNLSCFRCCSFSFTLHSPNPFFFHRHYRTILFVSSRKKKTLIKRQPKRQERVFVDDNNSKKKIFTSFIAQHPSAIAPDPDCIHICVQIVWICILFNNIINSLKISLRCLCVVAVSIKVLFIVRP